MKKHTLTSCSSISPPMRRSIQSARGTQIIRGGQTSRLPGGQEVEDRFAPWKSYPLSGHWRRPQLLRSTFRSAPESCPCCVSPTMRCGRLPSRSDVNISTISNYLNAQKFFSVQKCQTRTHKSVSGLHYHHEVRLWGQSIYLAGMPTDGSHAGYRRGKQGNTDLRIKQMEMYGILWIMNTIWSIWHNISQY